SDVVVVGVLIAPDDAAALVLLALDRLEGDHDLDILEACIIRDAEVEHVAGAFRGLGQNQTRLGRRRLIGNHFPATAFALAGLVALTSGGALPVVVLARTESPGLLIGCKAGYAEQRHHDRHTELLHHWSSFE